MHVNNRILWVKPRASPSEYHTTLRVQHPYTLGKPYFIHYYGHVLGCIHTYTIIVLYLDLPNYFVLTRVQPPVVGISIPAVSKDECLHAPLGWFLG